jgi:galactokinase/mevalonate kinase-like predicted kinase
MKIKTPLNIASHADIPAGTGMGSSGCFTVTLINALSAFQNKILTKRASNGAKRSKISKKVRIPISQGL